MNFVGGKGLEPAEVQILRSALKGISGEGVEIGSLDGYSATITMEASNLHLTCIDPFNGRAGAHDLPGGSRVVFHLPGSRAKFERNMNQWGPRITLIEGCSHNVRRGWKGDLDYLFIDGDHTYESVLQDYNDWTPLLRRGALLAMHDARRDRFSYGIGWGGPSTVANEHIYGRDEWEIVAEAVSMLIVRKR